MALHHHVKSLYYFRNCQSSLYMLSLLCLTSHQELDGNKENKTPVVRYCAVSAVQSSNKAPITDVQWLPPTFEVHRTEGQRGLKVQQLQI